MKVQDVMIRDIVTIDPSATLVEAAQRMREANVGMLPVVRDGEVRGVITDRDVVVRAIARDADLGMLHVGDCATAEPVCAHPDWDVERARETMARGQIGRLPVVDEGRLVGVVTLSSLALRSDDDDRTLEAAKAVSRRSVKRSARPAKGAPRRASEHKRAS
jgi:CBS domain-containing protein